MTNGKTFERIFLITRIGNIHKGGNTPTPVYKECLYPDITFENHCLLVFAPLQNLIHINLTFMKRITQQQSNQIKRYSIKHLSIQNYEFSLMMPFLPLR